MSDFCAAMSQLTETRSGKYMKKLIGRTDVEDVLKGLDRLTNEEVRMATAQVLKVTHNADDRVREVRNEVLDGTQPSSISQYFNSDVPRRKTDKGCHTTSRGQHGSSKMSVNFFLHSH